MFKTLLLKIRLEWYIWKLSGLTPPEYLKITDGDCIKKYNEYYQLTMKIQELQLFLRGIKN